MSQSVEKIVKQGDFILIEYTGYVKETDEVFDTTEEKIAKDSNIYNPKTTYGPTLVIVGEKWVPEGLDEALVGRKEEEVFEIEVSPEKGFGVRDSKKIKTTTVRKLRESGVKGGFSPGNIVEIEGRPAVIRAVVSGRVMLDFNPPLAGKYLRYTVKVERIIWGFNEKIYELIKHVDSKFADNIKLSVRRKEGSITIELGDNALKNPDLHLSKKPVADNILRYIKEIKKIRFIDKVIREEKQGEEVVKEEAEQLHE